MTNSSFHSMPTITRIINGIETKIELTYAEFAEIGQHYQRKCALEDLEVDLEDTYDVENIPAELLERIARYYIKCQDNSEDWLYCLRWAIDDSRDELEPYRLKQEKSTSEF